MQKSELIDTPGWLRVRDAAKYTGVSERTIRDWLTEGLSRSKVKGIVLIKVEWLDEWLNRFKVGKDQAEKIDTLVDEVLREF